MEERGRGKKGVNGQERGARGRDGRGKVLERVFLRGGR